jgi:hypothetical protein
MLTIRVYFHQASPQKLKISLFMSLHWFSIFMSFLLPPSNFLLPRFLWICSVLSCYPLQALLHSHVFKASSICVNWLPAPQGDNFYFTAKVLVQPLRAAPTTKWVSSLWKCEWGAPSLTAVLKCFKVHL